MRMMEKLSFPSLRLIRRLFVTFCGVVLTFEGLDELTHFTLPTRLTTAPLDSTSPDTWQTHNHLLHN